MKKLFLITLFFVVNISCAQHAWTKAKVYLKSGEILKGEARVPIDANQNNNGLYKLLSKENLRFRTSKKSKQKKYKPDRIDSIIFFGKTDKFKRLKYIPVKMSNSKLGFAQLIVDGKIKLVGRTNIVTEKSLTPSPMSRTVSGPDGIALHIPATYNNVSRSYQALYVIKNNNKIFAIDKFSLLKSFKNRAKNYFRDCTLLVKKLDNREFKKEDLIRIVEYYNLNCGE